MKLCSQTECTHYADCPFAHDVNKCRLSLSFEHGTVEEID